MRIILFLLVLLVFLAKPSSECFGNDDLVTTSAIYAGVRGSYLAWRSEDLHFFGYLIGASAGFDYRNPSNIYAGYRFYYAHGNIVAGDFKRLAQIMNMQGRVGYTYGKTLLFTPYVGLGLDISQFQKYHVDSPCRLLNCTNINVPLGILLTYHFSRGLSVGFDFQCTPEVDSFCRIGGFRSIRFELKKHPEYSIEIPIQFYYPKPRFQKVQYRLIPFYRTYYYGENTVSASCSSCAPTSIMRLPIQKGYEIGLKYEIAIW